MSQFDEDDVLDLTPDMIYHGTDNPIIDAEYEVIGTVTKPLPTVNPTLTRVVEKKSLFGMKLPEFDLRKAAKSFFDRVEKTGSVFGKRDDRSAPYLVPGDNLEIEEAVFTPVDEQDAPDAGDDRDLDIPAFKQKTEPYFIDGEVTDTSDDADSGEFKSTYEEMILNEKKSSLNPLTSVGNAIAAIADRTLNFIEDVQLKINDMKQVEMGRRGLGIAQWLPKSAPANDAGVLAKEKTAIAEIATELGTLKLPERNTDEPVLPISDVDLLARYKNLFVKKQAEPVAKPEKLIDLQDTALEDDLDIPVASPAKAPSFYEHVMNASASLKKITADINSHPSKPVWAFGSAAAGLLLGAAIIASTPTTNPQTQTAQLTSAPATAAASVQASKDTPALRGTITAEAPTAVQRAIATIRNDATISERVRQSLDEASAGRSYGKLDLAYYLNNGIGGVEKDVTLARAVAKELSADGYKPAAKFVAQMDGKVTAKPTVTTRYTFTIPATSKAPQTDVLKHIAPTTDTATSNDTVTDTGTADTGSIIAPVSASGDLAVLKDGIKKQTLSNGRTVYRDAKGRFVSAKNAFNKAAAPANLEPSMDSEPSPAVEPASAPAPAAVNLVPRLGQQKSFCRFSVDSSTPETCVPSTDADAAQMRTGDYINAYEETTQTLMTVVVDSIPGGAETTPTEDVIQQRLFEKDASGRSKITAIFMDQVLPLLKGTEQQVAPVASIEELHASGKIVLPIRGLN